MMGLMLGLALLVPPRTASNAGSLIARKLGPLFHWHRRGMANLTHIYPDKSQAERRQIMDGVWDNLGRTFGEFIRIAEVGAKVTATGVEHIPPDGTPVMFLTAHLANWEALRATERLSGRKIMVTYRRPNNVYADMLLKLRTRSLVQRDRLGLTMVGLAVATGLPPTEPKQMLPPVRDTLCAA